MAQQNAVEGTQDPDFGTMEKVSHQYFAFFCIYKACIKYTHIKCAFYT